jgi:aconitate hydratase 2/2-methylisocitrate dehydratase
MTDMGVLDKSSADIYKYLNFDQIPDYKDVADAV